MCGLLVSTDPDISDTEFGRALRLMDHRGPDHRSVLQLKGVRLGHTRLKVIDLDARSNQPFQSPDGRHVLVFNGEIYNFRQLAVRHGLRLRTGSDTEVLLEMYRQLGARCLPELEGMFAFVIVDTLTGELFAARDRLGVKPLYVRSDGGTVTFASEVAPILELHGIPAFDQQGVRQYRKLRACFNGRTVYKGIGMFPAGHYYAGGRTHRYWELPSGQQPGPSDEELCELLTRAVKDRLVADVPVGSYLSGGLDSSLVAAIANKPHTWTVGLADCNEFVEARIAADAIGSTHHEVLVSADEFVDCARELVVTRREPLSVPNEVLLYLMTREVKPLNTVVLSGEGADELFFGYDRVFRWAASAHVWDLAAFTKLYAYGSNDDYEIVEDALSSSMHLDRPIDIVAHFFQTAHLHGLLRRLDNSTMRCSVEARVPFVDCHALVERMAGVDFAARMEHDVVKSQLKRIARTWLPEAIVDRKKVGFPVPLANLGFGSGPGSAMDCWLEFNLRVLGAIE